MRTSRVLIRAIAFTLLLAAACKNAGNEPVYGDGTIGPPKLVDPPLARETNGSGNTPMPAANDTGAPPIPTTTAPAPPPAAPVTGKGFVIDHTTVDAAFDRIPQNYLVAAKSLRVFYGRLSHGDQLLVGATMIGKSKGAQYSPRGTVEAFYGSMDPGRDTPEWEKATRDRMQKPPAPNVVMWAWSSNVGKPERGGTQAYVEDAMKRLEKLEADFPQTRFVYFTGPAQTYKGATDYTKHNAVIRKFATERGKILFDFEDLDLYSPDGQKHAADTHACEWCDDWCKTHDCSMLDQSAKCVENLHAHCFTAWRKGQALWVLLARIAGWDGK